MMSPPPSYTPQAQSTINNLDDTSSHAESRTSEKISSSTARETASTDTRSDTTSATAAASREELLQQLAAAHATIARLKRENDEQSLRRRKEDAGTSKGLASGAGTVSMGVPTVQQQNGLPIQTVAILCLIVFLFTYILF